MSFDWLTHPLKRYVYNRRRSFLEAEFHKNAHNLHQRVMVGLELLTEPMKYGTANYVPISLEGNLELRCAGIQTVLSRLEFLLQDYNRVLNAPGKNPEWSSYPSILDPKHDISNRKWLDEYFATSNPESVRGRLRYIFRLLDTHTVAFVEYNNPEQAVLMNRCGHILRELEIIVEHYL